MRREPHENGVSPTARWLVHGAWKIAVAVVVLLLVVGIVSLAVD